MRRGESEHRHGRGVERGGDGREEEEEGEDVPGEEGDVLVGEQLGQQREEQWRGEDLVGRETCVHPAEVGGGEGEAVVRGRVDQPHGVDGVLAALHGRVEAVDDAAPENVVFADQVQVAALVQLQHVAVVDARHVVGVAVHRLLQLQVALVRLATLLLVGLDGRARKTLGEEGDHHQQDHDGEKAACDAGEEEGVATDPGELLHQSGEVGLGIAEEAAETGTHDATVKAVGERYFEMPPMVTITLKPRDCLSSEQTSLTYVFSTPKLPFVKPQRPRIHKART